MMKVLRQLFISLCFLSTSSRAALTAREQALGDWDLTIKTKCIKLGEMQGIVPSSMSKTRLDCRLSLFPNGTFKIMPKGDDDLIINGRWELGRNPYCPTDRFYDDLLLESYPRVFKRRGEGQVLKRFGFLFKCRIYGRYNAHDRCCSRMNHGMLLRKDYLSDPPRNLFGWWKQRPVCATFTGKPVKSAFEWFAEHDKDRDDDWKFWTKRDSVHDAIPLQNRVLWQVVSLGPAQRCRAWTKPFI